MTTTPSSLPTGGLAGGPGRPLLVGRELRCLAMSRAVIYGLGGGGPATLVWRWVVDATGWSPIPDQWFGSPEEASERFWEAVG